MTDITPSRRPTSRVIPLLLAAALVAPLALTAQDAPPDRGAVLGATRAKLRELRPADARAALAPLEATAASDAEVAVAAGRILEQEKKYGEAAAKLRAATSLAPADPQPWLYLGETLLRDNKAGDANAAFGKAVDTAKARLAGAPEDAGALYALGTAQMRLKQYDAAIPNLEKAAAIAGGDGEPLLSLGIALAFKNNWQGSFDRLSQAIERNGGLAYAYFYRGLSAERLKKKDVLVNDLERFLAMAPDAPEAARARAVVAAAKR